MASVVVIEQDEHLRNFLKVVLERRGHEVLLFANPSVCPLMQGDAQCRKDSPCADILIVDYQTSCLNAADFVEEQFLKGCKASPKNKSILIDPLQADLYKKAQDLGCALFHKPFKLGEMYAWLEACEKRLQLVECTNP
jgi:DNA-binding response OmpR family regulator